MDPTPPSEGIKKPRPKDQIILIPGRESQTQQHYCWINEYDLLERFSIPRIRRYDLESALCETELAILFQLAPPLYYAASTRITAGHYHETIRSSIRLSGTVPGVSLTLHQLNSDKRR
jgi:hypothetical protein